MKVLKKEYMRKTKTKKWKAHICKCHLLGRQNLVRARAPDDVPLMMPTRSLADMTSNKTAPSVMERPIRLREDETAATYLYMEMRVR